ncbi:MAG: MBL fold metallo-hydrolase [Bacteroidetes bacterium]|nr:MBL fold metallo-hydrolase [Bacteroidota bacterium]
MSLQIASINSGSNGNCYYIGNDRDAVLIDAGISCRETERRMARMGLEIERVKAIFISHEHTDHTRGVEVLSKKYQVPVFITQATHENSYLRIFPHLLNRFKAHEPVSVGELTVKAFPKRHDAMDPHSFVVSGGGLTVGVMTDIGSACEHVTRYFKLCDAAFLEANYDELMLETGNYPVHLKRRIKGENGHLSNRQALQIFLSFKSPKISHLLLSHLSQNNNRPEIVYDLFKRNAGNVHVEVASRYQETGTFLVSG